MMTRRSWRPAARYVVPAGLLGVRLLVARRRAGWLLLGAAGAAASFFRDPEREVGRDRHTVYAAADGVVTGVDEAVEEPWLPAGEVVRIRTFLSLHNVHVTRTPVTGTLTETENVHGGFAPALLGRADGNRRNRLAIDGPAGRVVVVLIAGSVARTITMWVGRGSRLAAGERLAIIHFGSRTDVLLPRDGVEVLVATGARVRAGVTPLARYHAAKGSAECEDI